MSADPTGYFFAALFSLVFVLAYYGIFRLLGLRAGIIEMAIGASAVSIAAIFLEQYIFTMYGTFIGLLVAAPVIEEMLKFAGTSRKRNTSAGVGVGLGFALVENILYFNLFLSGYSITGLLSVSFISSQIFLFIIMRGAFDPLLHSTLTGLSSMSWKRGHRFWLPVAIGFHIAYNFVAIIGQSEILFLLVADIAIIGPAVYLFIKKSGRKEEKVQVTTDKGGEPSSTAPEPEKIGTTVDLGSMELDGLVDYLRKRSAEVEFRDLAREVKISVGGYEKTRWVRRSLLISGMRRATYMEIGPYGAFLIAGLAALGGIAVWVLFL